MDRSPNRARRLGEFRYRFERPDLVLSMNNRDQRGFVIDGCAGRGQVDDAVVVNADATDGEAFPFEPATRHLGRWVLNLAGDDPPAADRSHRSEAADRVVARFGPATVEDDLLRLRTDQLRDFGSGFLDRRASRTPQRRGRLGIAELLAQEGEHRIEHLGIHRCGAIVIEIDRAIRSGHRLRILGSVLRQPNSFSRAGG